ncbi:endolytic transglycosylase MltG [Demequina sp.]|uniref:endolytic transglycosylase MltG n=1 Tax=Demequina sp. TaxID=2050685 RepID=UPI003A8C3F19
MNSAHDKLAAIQRAGAQQFAATDLAAGHGSVTRTVRRQRAVRGSVAAVAGVGLVGAGAFGIMQLGGPQVVGPMVTPSDSLTPTPNESASPTPAVTDTETPVAQTVTVEPGMRVFEIVHNTANAFGMSEEEAHGVFEAALPSQADGEVEGWLAPGTYDDATSVEEIAQQMVDAQLAALDAAGVAVDDQHRVLTLASIAQAEAVPTDTEDMRGVVTVIDNRLEQGTMLQLESPLRYYAALNGLDPSDDGWLIDTPYNTYMYEGLPPTPIGNPDAAAIEAALKPADEDWLYFAANPDTGDLAFSSTFHEFQLDLVEFGLIEEGDVLPPEN